MKEKDLNARLRNAAAIDDATVARLPLSDVLDDLSGEIMRTPAPVSALGDASPVPVLARRPRRRMRLVLAAAAAAAAVLVGTVVLPDGGGSPAFAAELVKVAEANPRVLVDKDGWSVTRVDQFMTDIGEMTFSAGDESLHVHWAPADQYEFYAKDREEVSPAKPVSVLGQEGKLHTYGPGDYETMLPPQGEVFLYLRGRATDVAAYRDVLAHLRTVDVDTWLSAIPASAVTPAQQSAAVEAMLRGVPLPPGFDRATIDTGTGVRDRYQLGAEVARAVGCAWVFRYEDALSSGDSATAKQAGDAMATSHSWEFLLDMNAEGNYPEAFWETADAMASGEPSEGQKTAKLKTGKDVKLSEAAPIGCKR